MEKETQNKTIVITGATSGIGLAAAEQLVGSGYSVIGVGRSVERCRNAETKLRRLNPGVRVNYLVADLSLQSDVNHLADQIKDLQASFGDIHLDGLLNNAGTFAYWMTLTQEGIELQWAVNHLTPFLLTQRLLPMLQAAPSARVVTVSSGSHTSGRIHWEDPQLRRHYNGLAAYSVTKLANVLFTLELNHRLGEASTVRAFAADPGLVKTEIGMKGTPAIAARIWQIRAAGGVTPEESARGIVRLFTEPSLQDSSAVYWKNGQPRQPSKHALDKESAGRLWDYSEQLCGLTGEQGIQQTIGAFHPASRVLITGAAGGLGKAFAVECASRGWDLFLNDAAEGPLEVFAAGVRQCYGVKVTTYTCDLTDAIARADLFARLQSEGTRIRMLINVAGIDHEGPFFEQTSQQIQSIVRLNVESTLAMTHAALQYRDFLNPFRIINVSSLAAYYPMPVKATYAASKRFLLDFSLALREELKGLGATVTVLCPAGMPTNAECVRAIDAQGWMGQITTVDTGRVACQTIEAAMVGRAVVIPGTVNRALQTLGGVVSPRLVAGLVGRRWKAARQKRQLREAPAVG